MWKEILLASILACPISISAKTVYAELVGYQKGLFSNKVK